MQTVSGSQSQGRSRRSDSNGLAYSQLKLVSVCKSVLVDSQPKVRLIYYAEVNERQRDRSLIVPLEDESGQPFAATPENACRSTSQHNAYVPGGRDSRIATTVKGIRSHGRSGRSSRPTEG